VGPESAGDPNEGLICRVREYVDQQAEAMIQEVEDTLAMSIPPDRRDEIRQQFSDAVGGALEEQLDG
jgi:hypothetical protein